MAAETIHSSNDQMLGSSHSCLSRGSIQISIWMHVKLHSPSNLGRANWWCWEEITDLEFSSQGIRLANRSRPVCHFGPFRWDSWQTPHRRQEHLWRKRGSVWVPSSPPWTTATRITYWCGSMVGCSIKAIQKRLSFVIRILTCCVKYK